MQNSHFFLLIATQCVRYSYGTYKMYIQLYKCIDKHHISLHAGLQFISNSASWRRYSILLTLFHDTSQLLYICKYKYNCSTLVWIRCHTWQARGACYRSHCSIMFCQSQYLWQQVHLTLLCATIRLACPRSCTQVALA